MTVPARTTSRTSSRKRGPWGLYAATVLLLLLYGLPALWLVLTSFKGDDQIVNDVASPIFRPTTAAYRSVLNNDLFQAMWNSFRIAFGATLIIMIVAVPAAYGLAHMKRGRGLSVGILIALQTIPLASFVIPMFKVLNTWHQLGSLRGVAIAISAMATPFTILLLRPFFLSVPTSIEEAAAVDGAGVFRIFFQVVLPTARNGILVVGVLNFIHAWGEFVYSISLLSNPKLYPISALLAQQINLYGTHWNNLMAVAIIAALPMVLLFVLVARHLSSGLALGYGK